MTFDEIKQIVVNGKENHEDFYCDQGPNKHEQEDHYTEGVNVVKMNVDLLESWLASEHEEAYTDYMQLPKEQRREIWEESDFHFGIFGYEEEDADFWWQKQE